jgi:hypothetical protein
LLKQFSKLIVFIVALIVNVLQTSHAQAKAEACSAPEYRQFDFWIGDWDTYDVDTPNKAVAQNRVDLILDRCVIHEVYDGFNGGRGESFSIYDSSRRQWHQSWVTNKGVLLLLDGGLQNGAMVMQGLDRSQSGPRLIRGIWKQIADGVRETAEVSSDDGKTWQVLFDIVFRPLPK